MCTAAAGHSAWRAALGTPCHCAAPAHAAPHRDAPVQKEEAISSIINLQEG